MNVFLRETAEQFHEYPERNIEDNIPKKVLNLSQIEDNFSFRVLNLSQKVLNLSEIEDNLPQIEDNIRLGVLNLSQIVLNPPQIVFNISQKVLNLRHIVLNISLWVHLFPFRVPYISFLDIPRLFRPKHLKKRSYRAKLQNRNELFAYLFPQYAGKFLSVGI
jgi:hypothetical protein